jgi:guanylate kinase
MHEPLFLLVGKSASGKTTIANILEQKYGHRQVSSYTTRPPRYDGEIGHRFITEEEFNNLDELVAYTEYNGHRYGTTAKQLDACSIYVVDVPGVETLLQKYQNNRQIVIIYFDTNVYTRINRMLDRGDSDMAIISRLLQDEKDDWYQQLDHLVWHYNHIARKNVDLYSVNANEKQDCVLEMVKYYMEDAQWLLL